MWHGLFFLQLFNIPFLFYMFSVLLICTERSFKSSLLRVLDAFCIMIHISFFRPEEFSSMILLKIFSVTFIRVSSPSFIPWSFHSVSGFLGILCQDFFFIFNIFFDQSIYFFLVSLVPEILSSTSHILLVRFTSEVPV